MALEANEALALALRPLLRLREDIARSLAELTRRLLAETRGSELCRRLMGVPGVGAITAYAFVATPYEFICKMWATEPQRFTANPPHQMPGLNN